MGREVKDLFISYSHKDMEYVEAFCKKLEDKNVSYFIDREEIEPGSGIREEAVVALAQAEGVLMIVSEDSKTSEWIPFEVGYAMAHCRTVYALRKSKEVPIPPYSSGLYHFEDEEKALAYFGGKKWQEHARLARLCRSPRKITITQAAQEVGLVDIEGRSNTSNYLPSSLLYQQAKAEIVILGNSASRTFEMQFEELDKRLSEGIGVRVMILDPRSSAIPGLEEVHRREVRDQIRAVIKRVVRAGWVENPKFEIRFLDAKAPFNAVMIDGDIAPTSDKPKDMEGRIRVTPAINYQTQHRVPVMQFAKVEGEGSFDAFAADLREQWVRDGKECRELLMPGGVGTRE